MFKILLNYFKNGILKKYKILLNDGKSSVST